MTAVMYRIPAADLPAEPADGHYEIRVRGRNPEGPGEPSTTLQSRPVAPTRVRRVRLNGEWVDIGNPAVANALQILRTRATANESETVAQSVSLTELEADIAGRATARALDLLQVDVRETEDGLSALAQRVTSLVSEVATLATATALQALTTRVETNELGVLANAQEITALEAAHGGRILGPAQNTFTGATKEAAATARDTYQAENPMVTWEGTEGTWLSHYDADNDINIELLWGVEYIYQRRVSGQWVDNGEALARAAAVATLNATVESQGNTLTSVSSQVSTLVASIGNFTAAIFQETLARVTSIENLDGDTDVAGLARWTVKTRVGDLVGGIGLLNDGTNVDFIVQANRFAVVPPGWTGDDDEMRIPFAVHNGVVYLDVTAIRAASITGAAIANAVITNAHIVDATIQFGKIQRGDIFNLTISNRIQSVGYSPTGTRGFRFNRDGTFVLRGGDFRGNIQSDNFSAGADGWIIRRNGTAEFDAGVIRGTLAADHIDSDVRNVRVLGGSRTGTNIADEATVTVSLNDDVRRYDYITGIACGTYTTTRRYATWSIPTSVLLVGTAVNAPATIHRAVGFFRTSGGDTEFFGAQVWRSSNGRTLYLKRSSDNPTTQSFFTISGVREPS